MPSIPKDLDFFAKSNPESSPALIALFNDHWAKEILRSGDDFNAEKIKLDGKNYNNCCIELKVSGDNIIESSNCQTY